HDLVTTKGMPELHHLTGVANKATDPAERRRLKSELLAAGWLMGLLKQDRAAGLRGAGTGVAVDAAEIEAVIAARKDARARKDWAESDRIRNDLAARGILLEDKGGETSWRVAS